MGKKTALVICVLLLAYFVFTSGIIYEWQKVSNLSITDIPYSIALSGERTGILGFFTENDIACGKWLGKTKGTLILADYNGINLVSDYVPGYDRISPVNIYNIRVSYSMANKRDYYLFLTEWNIKNQKLVDGISPALRAYEPLPDVSNMILVFKRGDSVVYYCGN